MKWIVELEPGVYLKHVDMLHIRTEWNPSEAQVFDSHPRACRALTAARLFGIYPQARVTLPPVCVYPHCDCSLSKPVGPNGCWKGLPTFVELTNPKEDKVQIGELKDAQRRALNLFDKWNEVADAFKRGTSSYYEMQGIIEDAVEFGAQAASRTYSKLESEK